MPLLIPYAFLTNNNYSFELSKAAGTSWYPASGGAGRTDRASSLRKLLGGLLRVAVAGAALPPVSIHRTSRRRDSRSNTAAPSYGWSAVGSTADECCATYRVLSWQTRVTRLHGG